MAFSIQFVKNDIITSLLLSVVTTILTLINIPKYNYIDEKDNKVEVNRAWIAIKTFLISFVVYYAILYFFSSDPSSSLISNMKQGEPNF